MLRFLFRRSSSSPEFDVPDSAETFTYHRKSGMAAMVCGFLLAAVVELTVVHYFAAKWSAIVAWLLTISSVWVAMSIIAQLRTIAWRPHYLDQNTLVLRNGMYELARIPLDHVESVQRTTATPKAASSTDKPLQVCVPVSHNVVLELNHENQATLLYGQTRSFRSALVFVDDPEAFQAAIESGEDRA